VLGALVRSEIRPVEGLEVTPRAFMCLSIDTMLSGRMLIEQSFCFGLVIASFALVPSDSDIVTPCDMAIEMALHFCFILAMRARVKCRIDPVLVTEMEIQIALDLRFIRA